MFQEKSQFQARSGRTIKVGEDGTMRFHLGNGYLAPDQAMDAEEYFQAKRDEELGRWRWPENPHLVVYPRRDGAVLVLNEMSVNGGILYRRGDAVSDIESEAACAYFAVHHEPKPWHEAKDREVWVLTHVKGETGAFIVDGNRFEGGSWSLPRDAASITEGRRIWPEDAS